MAIKLPGYDYIIRQYRSFGYKDLKHMEACSLFDRAFVILADHLGIPVDQLIDHAMRREYPRGLP